MATLGAMLAAVEAFVDSPKTILGSDQGYQWGPGYSKFERKAKFPIAVNGEAEEAARLEVIGFPDAVGLKFRLVLCFNAAICRLDYTDETHQNTNKVDADDIPYVLTGPHYHSWALNRRFFKGVSKAPELHNAKVFEMQGSFDSILRWFCSESKIAQPSGRHMIALPERERLL